MHGAETLGNWCWLIYFRIFHGPVGMINADYTNQYDSSPRPLFYFLKFILILSLQGHSFYNPQRPDQ